MVLDVAQQLYYISPSPFLFPPPRPFQTFSNFHIPLTPHLPSSLSQNTPSHLSTPRNIYRSTLWLPCHHSKSTLQPSPWALDSTLHATQGNCPVILPPLSYITKFPSQSVIPIIPWTCWHFSHLTKTTIDSIPHPSYCPISQLPFAAKCPKVLSIPIFSAFPLPVSPKPTIPWKPLIYKPSVTSLLLILGVSSWSSLSLASQQGSAQLFIPLETCSSLGSRTAHSPGFPPTSQRLTCFTKTSA